MSSRIQTTIAPTETAVASETILSLITSGNIRLWGMKSALSLIDQALTSGAGFGMNVLLARWLPADQYGAFAVAFTGYLFLTGFHNVLLLEPLSVFGPARHAQNLTGYFHAQIQVHGVLVWPLAGFSLAAAAVLSRFAPGGFLAAAVAGGGIALPFLLFLWLARRFCYVLQRPGLAVMGSGFYLLFSISGLVALRAFGELTACNAFLSNGLGSFIGACLILFFLNGAAKQQAKSQPGFWKRVLAEDWQYGRWLVGSAILYAISTYGQTFFVAAFLGLTAAGVLRAMQIPSLLMTQVITAIGLLVLPSFSYDFGEGGVQRLRRKAMLVSAAVGLVAIGYFLLLLVGHARIEYLLYGGKYSAEAWLIPLLALIPCVNGISAGYSMALRASQQPHFDLLSNAFAAPVAVVSTILFTRWWGLAGAALSMVVSFGVLNFVTVVAFRRTLGRRKTEVNEWTSSNEQAM